MNFRAKRRIKLEFVIPESAAVGLSDLEGLLRELTDDIKVEDNSYLSEVLSKTSGKSPRSSKSALEYNTRALRINNQVSKELTDSSRHWGYYGPCNQNSVVSDASEISDLSESEGETLGSKDSTRSADSDSEDLSFISYSDSVFESPVIQNFVRQNDKQDLKLYHSKRSINELKEYPTGGEIKRTKYY